jgi:serine/threonine protein phosphatase PrpC
MPNFFEKLKKNSDKGATYQVNNSGWDDLKNINLTTETTEEIDPKIANAERQRRKITAYLLYEHNPDYISAPDVQLNPDDQNNLREQLADGTITRDDERALLLSMKDPIRKLGVDGVFGQLSTQKHYLRILAAHTEPGFSNWQHATANSLTNFLILYPTPIDFDAQSEVFLGQVKASNSEDKYQEYVSSMAAFKKNVYGKRQEYWEQIKLLEADAAEWKKQKEVGEPDDKAGERAETPVKDFGYYEMSRSQAKIGMLANNPGERLPADYSEDAIFASPEKGLFAVFDGAGGYKKETGAPRIASQTAVQKLQEISNGYNLENEGHIAWAMNSISAAIAANPNAGVSTGVIAKVIETNGAKKLAYASVGDSRIYIVRQNSIAHQITIDEGEGNRITNALGAIPNREASDNCTKQFGMVDLWPGDRIVLCSDGITGDRPEETMSDNQIANIVGLAWNSQQAAAELVESARKIDDRSAIVLEV